MEDIEQELEAKSIEREVEIKEVVSEEPQPSSGEPEPVVEPVKKTKRARSEKQIAAFEKARLKRAEGIAARKKLKEEQKLQKKEEKKQVKISQGKPSAENVATQGSSLVKEQNIPKPVVNAAPSPSNREQVIQNHYYYYGVPPPHDEYTKPNKKKKKSKRPPTPSSSESESEEEYYQDEPPAQEQQYYQTPKPTYKFGFA